MQKIRHLLATDLDGTLVGEKEGLEALLGHYDSLPHSIGLAYITGRHRESAMGLIREEGLPMPHILISDVGTAIFSGPELEEDPAWKRRMTENWDPEIVMHMAASVPGLRLQDLPDTKRVSFHSDGPGAAELLRHSLRVERIPHTFIFSSGRDVDILPDGGGKGEALRYVIDRYTEEGADILVAGDSGNDLDMLMLGHPAVIVSNAQPELAGIEGHDMLFRATRPCAGGILEAWHHFYGNPVKTV